jgi:hypothetical protein
MNPTSTGLVIVLSVTEPFALGHTSRQTKPLLIEPSLAFHGLLSANGTVFWFPALLLPSP